MLLLDLADMDSPRIPESRRTCLIESNYPLREDMLNRRSTSPSYTSSPSHPILLFSGGCQHQTMTVPCTFY